MSLFESEVPAPKTRIENVVTAIESIRVPYIREEYELHEIIRSALTKHAIPYVKEFSLGPRNRIDFFIPGAGIGIEVKKGKPARNALYSQLSRYAAFSEVHALIVVVNRTVTGLPETILDKPCVVIGLNRLWGIAL